MSKNKYGVVSGVSYFARVHQPDPNYGNYSLLLRPDKESEKLLVEQGIVPAKDSSGKVKTDDKGGNLFKFTRKHKLPDGTVLGPPTVVDEDRKHVDKLVGNGSKVKVKYVARNWTYAGKSGVSANLVAVKVMDLVEFIPKKPKDEFSVDADEDGDF